MITLLGKLLCSFLRWQQLMLAVIMLCVSWRHVCLSHFSHTYNIVCVLPLFRLVVTYPPSQGIRASLLDIWSGCILAHPLTSPEHWSYFPKFPSKRCHYSLGRQKFWSHRFVMGAAVVLREIIRQICRPWSP